MKWNSVRPRVTRAPRLTAPALERLSFLLLLLAAAFLLFTAVLPKDPVLYERVRSYFGPSPAEQHAAAMERLRAKDPPLGKKLPDPLSALRSSPTLVVVMGECSTCALHVLEEIEAVKKRAGFLTVVAVSSSKPAPLKAFRRDFKLTMSMVSDPKRRYMSIYNAAWTPRTYLLSRSAE